MVWPEPGEALDRTVAAEQAIEDLHAEAFARWAPIAAAVALPIAVGAVVVPPNVAALTTAAALAEWTAISEAVIVAGVSLLWAAAVVETMQALDIPLPDVDPVDAHAAVLDTFDEAVLRIVDRAVDLDRGELHTAAGIVEASPPLRQARDRVLAAQRENTARTAISVQDRAARAAAAHPQDVAEQRRAVADTLTPGSTALRDIARSEGYEAAGVLNDAAVTAARQANAEFGEALEKTWLCVHPDTLVESDEAIGAARRWHTGLMATVRTSDDALALTVTPEHKVLTANRGWVAAQDLCQGDHLIKVNWGHTVGCPDVKHEPPSISEVLDPLFDPPPPHKVRAMRSGVDLDVDHPSTGEVEVVRADGKLRNDFNPGGPYSSSEVELMLPDLARDSLLRERSIGQGIVGHGAPHERGAGLVVPRTLGSGILPTGAQNLSCRSAAGADTLLLAEDSRDSLRGASDLTADISSGHARQIELVQVVGVDVGPFSGHVYDLQTLGCWFTANKVVVHNCTLDGKTRPSHWAADGQRVPLESHFTVGGA